MRDLSAQRLTAAGKATPVTRILQIGALALCGALVGQPALAASTQWVSAPINRGNSNGRSGDASISADGRFIAFASGADNLITGDNNGLGDIFVRDRRTGVTERASIASGGVEADARSDVPSISANGRFVAFDSYATNLVASDTNAAVDVFVHDRQTGITERVSVDSAGAETTGGYSGDASVSASGRFVAFESDGVNLVAGDTNAQRDIFVHDRQTGVTERVSVDSSGAQAVGYSSDPCISANGRFVAFYSEASDLVAGDANGKGDIFVHDRLTGATERVSVADDGSEANEYSYDPSISADGRFVAFDSDATNLVAGDTNGQADIFVHDRLTGATQRVSLTSDGAQATTNSSYEPSISADGRFVTFYSYASDLVPGDTNDFGDVFVHDRLTGTTERASISENGTEADRWSERPVVSADGRFVAFRSGSTNLVPGDTDQAEDVYVRDRGPQPDGNDDLAVDFGSAGLWQYLDNATWQKIHNASPRAVASGDLDGSLKDEVIASFAGAGLWARYDNASWKKLHNASPARFVTGDLDGNGSDELIVGFGGAGLWVFYNNNTWVKRHNAGPQDLAVGDLNGNGRDELVVDFGGAGLWALYGSTWKKLDNRSPQHMATGDLDGNGMRELIADFGAIGIWARYNNASWAKLHNGTSQGLTAGDFDGNGQEDLMVDFGAAGVWVRYNNATWVERHNGSPQRLLATDLDGNGKAEAVLDFGAAGLWVRHNDTSWTKLHPAATQGFAAGGVD